MKGTRTTRVSEKIEINCISPDASKLLDDIMELWFYHESDLKKSFPEKPITIYGFAYWLVRYSGLVKPTQDICQAKEMELNE